MPMVIFVPEPAPPLEEATPVDVDVTPTFIFGPVIVIAPPTPTPTPTAPGPMAVEVTAVPGRPRAILAAAALFAAA